MKRKINVTLSSELLRKIDELAGPMHSRSAVIERALRDFFRERSRRKMHSRDVRRINAAADYLNREAADVLHYQAPRK